jgi:hypothetical protein
MLVQTVDISVQHQGFIQVMPKGSTTKSAVWVWGILKANMLLYKDMKVRMVMRDRWWRETRRWNSWYSSVIVPQ